MRKPVWPSTAVMHTLRDILVDLLLIVWFLGCMVVVVCKSVIRWCGGNEKEEWNLEVGRVADSICTETVCKRPNLAIPMPTGIRFLMKSSCRMESLLVQFSKLRHDFRELQGRVSFVCLRGRDISPSFSAVILCKA